MSEIKYVGETWMAKCNHLTPLHFKGLMLLLTNCMYDVIVQNDESVSKN